MRLLHRGRIAVFLHDREIYCALRPLSGALSAMLDLGQGSGPMDHAFDLTGMFAKEAE